VLDNSVDQSDTADLELDQRVRGRCAFRYLWVNSRGLSRANNIGMLAARYDVLVFTHDDVLVTASWLRALVRALVSAGDRAIVTGRVLPSEAREAGGFAPSTKTPARATSYVRCQDNFSLNLRWSTGPLKTANLGVH
jgi:hypothetical protein